MSASLLVVLLAKVTVVLAVGLVSVRLARRSRAATRHVLLTAALAAAVVVPAASVTIPPVAIPMPSASQGSPWSAVVVEPEQTSVTHAAVPPGAAGAPADRSPGLSGRAWLAALWLGVTIGCLVPLLRGLRRMRSLRRSGVPWAHGQAIARAVAAESGVTTRIEVLQHEATPGPLTFGAMTPTILLPADAARWSDDDLRRAIVHELEHVRRRDWATQCMARVVCACYWFHPLVWAVWRRLVVEAERACDDAVLRQSEATAYADQLVGLAARLSAAGRRPMLAMASRRDLGTRVRAVLDAGQRRGQATGRSIAAIVAAGIAIVLMLSPLRIVASPRTASDQSSQTTKLRYDVASIKRCVAEEVPTGARGTAGGTNARFSPGRFSVPCVTTEQLIYLAYASYGAADADHLINDTPGSASNAVKVRGGPDWVHSLKEKYEIEATAVGATERALLMGAMLRTLLEERFKLTLHRETEEVPMLELTVGKDGLKMTPMKDGDCVQVDAGVFASTSAGRNSPLARPPDLRVEKPPCGVLNMMNADGRIRWTFGGFGLDGLARQLSSALKIHVIDRTAVTDKFVFRFEFQQEAIAPPAPDSRVEPRRVTSIDEVLGPAPSLNAALDSLGLTIEKVKGPRGYLVIDHIERPTPDGPAAEPARAAGPGARR
jgi:uncharacterized protein (TIGR03435 family)